MQKPGIRTPAIQGSKYTRSSCSPKKYQGALAGFGVIEGLAGSSKGASIVMDHTHNTIMATSVTRPSMRNKPGQACTLSGNAALPGAVPDTVPDAVMIPPPWLSLVRRCHHLYGYDKSEQTPERLLLQVKLHSATHKNATVFLVLPWFHQVRMILHQSLAI